MYKLLEKYEIRKFEKKKKNHEVNIYSGKSLWAF